MAQQDQNEQPEISGLADAMALQRATEQLMERIMAEQIAMLQSLGLPPDAAIEARETLRYGLRQVAHAAFLQANPGREPEQPNAD